MLLTLEEKPTHGYAIIQGIGRFYGHMVSPGIVYPTLQELLQDNLIRLVEEGERKVYALTDRGKEFLETNKELIERLKTQREASERIGRYGVMKSMEEIEDSILENAECLSSEKLDAIDEIIRNAKGKILSIIFSSE
ncbi:MAG: PadR family transcriptional regulator [Candidatus Thermoplasmatota archaeon]|nr:PadR family transcriptional regulator [Candidatus Thermoplasmatota archaeon]MCL5793783.1 PadR family transcriptional regulator [Candidatus Thermoplasmatota archaeon]